MSHKLNVAVITGGHASEKEISLKSAKMVFDNLDREKYNCFLIDISTFPWSINSHPDARFDMNTCSLITNHEKIKLDFACVMIHGSPAEDGKLQGYLDMMEVDYSCSGVLSSALTFDKQACKDFLKNFDVPMPKSQSIKQGEQVTLEMAYPLFVKPNKNGSSYGVSKVEEASQLESAIQKAFEFDTEVIVEEFINGREITCGAYSQNGEIMTLPCTEIITKNAFFDYEAKYKGESDEITPADISKELTLACQELTKYLYRVLQCKGFVRADYILNDGTFYYLEINTIPGMSPQSLIPQQVEVAGIQMKDFISIIIQENSVKNHLDGIPT